MKFATAQSGVGKIDSQERSQTSKRIFHGWIIIAVSLLSVAFAHSGVVNFGFSSFILPLSQEFGFSRGSVSFALTASLLAYTAGVTFTGALIDKHGARRVLMIGTALYGALVCSMYFMTGSLWHLYGMYALLGIVGTSVSMIPHARLAVSWFDKRKGLALALSSCGAGLAAVLIPPLIVWLIDSFGWREAYAFLGSMSLLLCLPLIHWLVRNTPHEMATYVDGIPPDASRLETPAAMAMYGYAFRDCLRNPRFWRIAGLFALFAATHAGPVSQLIPLLVDYGFTRSTAANTASFLGAALIVGRLSCGYLVDRFHAPYVAAGFQLMPVFGFVALVVEPGYWTAILGVVTLGLAMGAEFDVMPFFCVQYFGRFAFGKNYGVVLIMFALGGGIAAALAGASYDVFASYSVLLSAAAALSTVGVCLLASIGPPAPLPKQSGTS
jgi:MFS family permease